MDKASPLASYALFTSPVSAFVAPIRVLFEMFSRWPLYFSQEPAAEMWSVVHFPLTLKRTFNPFRSVLPNGSKGSRRARREEVGETTTGVEGEGVESLGKSARFPSSKP